MRRIFYLCALILLCGVKAQAQDTNLDYFVEADVNNPMPFVGQQIIYRFRLYIAVDEKVFYGSPDFQGYWKAEMGRTDASAQRNGRSYNVIQFDTALYPTYPGEIVIAPATITIPDTVFQDGEVLVSNSIVIQSRPLPEGAPENFGGAVGDFTMQATLDQQSLALGEPFSLRLIVTGTGNVEQLPAPDLPLPADWRVYPNPTAYRSAVQNGILVGEKTFEWLIAPAQAGSQTLPEITLHYFDPANLVYRSASSAAVNLEILPAEESPTQIAAVLAQPALAIKPISASLQSGQPGVSLFFWILWLIPPAVLGGVWWWTRQQSIIKSNRLKSQQSRALLRAKEHLQAARKMPSDLVYRRTAETILTYLGDKLDVSPANVVQSQLRDLMVKRGASESLVDNVLACLEWAESGRYAPIEEVNILPLIEQTYKALATLDSTWKKE
jgi:BatD DUF11 like domain